MRRLARALLALATAASTLMLVAPPASAGGLVVTSLGNAVADDGVCTIREAITAANTDTASGSAPGECPAGSGSDVITFAVAGTIHSGGWTITSDLTIDGGGAITVDASSPSGGQHVLVEAGATATLSGLTLTGGSAAHSGSIDNHGTLAVVDSTIRDNVASQQGGGIYNQSGGVLTVRDSTLTGNDASIGGALYVEVGSSATVTGSTIAGNAAVGGAGVYVAGALVLANSTVADNAADGGAGGIAVAGGAAQATLLNVTVTGNNGTTPGDGLTVDDSASVTVRNSIVAGNADGQVAGTLDVAASNLIQASTAGLLGALGDNGGPTRTAGLLATGTLAIDRGDPATCAAAPVGGYDQRGLRRPSGPACDIGAVERDTVAPLAGAPQAALAQAVSLSGTSPRATLTWGGSDPGGTGVASYVLQRSIDGAAYATIASPTSPTQAVIIATGHTYRFRAAAVDRDGNQGAWATSRALVTTLTQQRYAGITWGGTWTSASSAAFSGGSVRHAQKAGASARLLFTGRGIAFVTTRSTARGKAKIYINGTYRTTIDLGGATAYRRQAWAYTWPSSGTRTIKVVVSGTSGRPRIDVDAFVVLK